MIKFEGEELGAATVVDEHNVAYMTQNQGWVLRAVITESTPEDVAIKTPSHQAADGRWVSDSTRFETHVVTRAKYILGQSKDATLKTLAEKLDRSERDRHAAEEAAKTNAPKLKKLEEEATANAKSIEQLKADVSGMRTQLTSIRETADARQRELDGLKTELKSLEDRDKTIQRLHLLEDWVRKVTAKIDVRSFDLVPPELPKAKTWAERLSEESDEA